MDALTGQQQAVSILENQLTSGRLHHVYIFHGPVGVGKCTAALAFARILLCPKAQPDLTGRVTACGECQSCQLISDPTTPATESEADSELGAAASPHPDLHIIRKELAQTSSVNTVRNRKQMNIPVDLLRELIIGGTTSDGRYHEAAAYKSPTMRHGKVFIVDEAELLDRAGQNALLKTLEEPTPGTTLILVTSSEDRLLPTIRSRCQRVAFVPLSDEAVDHWLQEQAALPEPDRQWLGVFANGSLGRARIALDYDLVEWAKTVLPAVDQMARGRPQGELGGQIAKMIDELAKAWVRDRPNASKEAANKLAAGLMWSMIASHARQRLAELAENCEAETPIQNEAQLEPWLGVIDGLREAERLLATNVNLSLVCDHLVARMEQALKPTAATPAS